ncbi:hypothetical protein [Pseudobacteriovorax antillogorgiicola]|uniref:ATP synthase I chain n=1 Tax=Pseudobacteriovorax antillogorgiicola TaxID=1513793 RepID=A0A1Y6B4B4_9BACT|nr:hypothetical protein [Pseudobacteriovorax antillogorgiicola]TCS59148.1 hypothetical protein EDD56_10151 [Pseudobacteriovorax antillogorgiicola]SME91241.1 hypothetical protein SAMN06296036_101435 [Pseudobacteriovorax antillogorgiicola]
MNFKPILMSLGFVGLVILVGGLQFLKPLEALALMIGFLLFALNIMTMGFLALMTVRASKGQVSRAQKPLALLLGLFKFAILVLGLYLSLIHYKLPGIYLGCGALLALVVILWNYTTQYLKSMNATASE